MTRIWWATLALAACGWGAGSPDQPEQHDHVDVERDGAHGDEVVVLSPEAVAAARITVVEATEGTLEGQLSLPARIALDPRREALVSAWIDGQVETISVRTGDSVRRGQKLAWVQSPEIGLGVAAFRAASARHDAANARLERLQRLEADGVSSRAQVLDAEATHAEADAALEAAEERLRILGVPMAVGSPHDGEHFPSRVPVTTPIAGTVLEADASAGQRVVPGQSLFRVGDLDEVWLLLDVYERDLSSVRQGQSVRFDVQAWPEREFEGEVAQVGDWVDPDARTVEVRVVVENADHALKPNMFATATLSVDARSPEAGIVLPEEAVQQVEGRDSVFIEVASGRFVPRPVVVAEAASDRVRLLSGVQPSDRVVVDGAFTLKSELEKGELGEGHAH